MLATLTWLVGLTAPLFTVFRIAISWRDIILIGGGLFLIAKATHEIHLEVEGGGEREDTVGSTRRFALVVAQIVLIDIVFSVDSIITAIGTTEHLEIMVAAVVIAMLVMYTAAGPVGEFIAEHPTTKMLVLAFLVLIGVALIADGFDIHIPRGYIYFAMAFAAAVEAINIIVKRRRRGRRRGAEERVPTTDEKG
jgi:predicted tellurium resistance membrane protein TerC